jgi:hypothetical protein
MSVALLSGSLVSNAKYGVIFSSLSSSNFFYSLSSSFRLDSITVFNADSFEDITLVTGEVLLENPKSSNQRGFFGVSDLVKAVLKGKCNIYG